MFEKIRKYFLKVLKNLETILKSYEKSLVVLLEMHLTDDNIENTLKKYFD